MYLIEAIKEVKKLNDELNLVLSIEQRTCTTTYRNEEEKISTEYDFYKTRETVKRLSDRIIRLKKAINKANNEVLIGVENLTISDALIKATLINKEINLRLDMMSTKDKKVASVDMRNDGLIYTELLYDPKECARYVEEQKELLTRIQIGIDRANIITEIEI